MILSTTVKFKVNGARHISHLKKLGYNPRIGDIIELKVEDLSHCSTIKINVKCDVCYNEYETSYHSYIKNYKKHKIYSCSTKCRKNKRIKTCLEKYGVEHPMKSKNIQIKKNKTCLKNHGVEYPIQNKEIKEKTKITNLEKYGTICPLQNIKIQEKSKSTLLKNYGVEHPLQSKEIQEKAEQTCLKNLNVKNPFQSKEIKEKIKINKNEKYGDIYFNNRIKCELTSLKKYGFINAMQNKKILEKSQINSYKRTNYKNTELHYQASYELDFLDKYFNEITIENGPSIKYLFEDSNKVYHSDFYLPNYNLIIEIKSDYTYNYDLEKNLAKQKACLDQGYNFLFIINKDYDDFIINLKHNYII